MLVRQGKGEEVTAGLTRQAAVVKFHLSVHLLLAQVSLSGETHSLSPLEAASPGLIHVFSKPMLYRNALWLPYRRDHGAVQAAMEAAVQLQGSGAPLGGEEADQHGGGPCPVKAVFAHADIVSLASLHLPVPLAPDSGTQGLSFPKTSSAARSATRSTTLSC